MEAFLRKQSTAIKAINYFRQKSSITDVWLSLKYASDIHSKSSELLKSVHIFTYSDWIRRDAEYLSVLSPNAGKYGPEKLRIRTLFTQCTEQKNFISEPKGVFQYLVKYLTGFWMCLWLKFVRFQHWKRQLTKIWNRSTIFCNLVDFQPSMVIFIWCCERSVCITERPAFILTGFEKSFFPRNLILPLPVELFSVN